MKLRLMTDLLQRLYFHYHRIGDIQADMHSFQHREIQSFRYS